MKKFVVSAVACLFLCLPIYAIDVDVPDLHITGAEKLVPLGDIAKIGLSKIETKPAYFQTLTVDFKIFDGDIEKAFIPQTDNTILVGTGVANKQFKVFASVSYLYLIKDKNDVITGVEVRTRLLTDTLKVGAEKPPAPPTPPTPVILPDGKFKISQRVYSNVYALVTDANKVAQAQALADSYTGISSAIAAGTVKTGKDALEMVTSQNRVALGSSVLSWDAYFTNLQEVLYPMYQNRQLVTVQDFQVLFNEIALGLRSVK